MMVPLTLYDICQLRPLGSRIVDYYGHQTTKRRGVAGAVVALPGTARVAGQTVTVSLELPLDAEDMFKSGSFPVRHRFSPLAHFAGASPTWHGDGVYAKGNVREGRVLTFSAIDPFMTLNCWSVSRRNHGRYLIPAGFQQSRNPPPRPIRALHLDQGKSM